MKRFSEKSGYATMTELNVTPMLDLAFTLLIIFIITTPLMENSIEITLPSASHKDKAQTPPILKTVTIDKRGNIYLEGKPLNVRQLERELSSAHESDPELAVVVRPDKDLKVQGLVDVFDALAKAKITRLGIMHLDDAHK